MREWVYDGYTKVHSEDRRHMIETWIWKCSECGFAVRKPYENRNMPTGECPVCARNTPKKPKTVSRKGAYPRIERFCPNCLKLLYRKERKCPNCGQLIKLEGDETNG